jgi:quinol monooxygenase YgiN
MACGAPKLNSRGSLRRRVMRTENSTSGSYADWRKQRLLHSISAPSSNGYKGESPVQHVLIIHEVENYQAWKAVFDHAAAIRKEAGERSYQVLKFENEPNKIVHFSVWTSIANAKAFFESPKLVQIRKEAGVKAPEFIYLDQLEAGNL